MNNSRIIILGGNGMLGHLIATYLNSKYDVICVLRNEPPINIKYVLNDYDNFYDLIKLIITLSPTVIINTVGVLVDEASNNLLIAIKVNSILPRLLEQQFRETNTRIIQISTDCVFSGKNGPYNKYDLPDAEDPYGISKYLGDINNNKDLTIRTSIIGPNIINRTSGLFDFIFFNNKEVNGYSNVFWSGITTLELSIFIEKQLFNGISGLIFLTNGEIISKYNLLEMINKIFLSSKKKIIEDTSKLANKGLIIGSSDYQINKTYIQMLTELHEWIHKNKNMYIQYFFPHND